MAANDADAPDSMYIGHVERGFDPLFHQFPFLFTRMATRALIGLQLADGSILSAYHHWDGYPEWLGVKLNEKFNTKEKVAELIDGGDMSTAGLILSGAKIFQKVSMLPSIILLVVKIALPF